MEEKIIASSKEFWAALEKADAAGMQAFCDPTCFFVHIGGNCDLDREMEAFEKIIFQPTEIVIHSQEVHGFGDVQICLTDVDYGLLLGGNPTTHHFMVTEVWQKQGEEFKLIQFTFTALVH